MWNELGRQKNETPNIMSIAATSSGVVQNNGVCDASQASDKRAGATDCLPGIYKKNKEGVLLHEQPVIIR